MENVALWHERDISHSSVERVIGPDTTVALDFSLARMTGVIEKLIVYPKMMKKNLEALGGLVFSQRVLLALTQLGMSREDAYETVQKNAMKVWKDGTSFLTQLQKDKQIKKLMAAEDLAALFDLKYHTKNINHIFERVFNTKE